MVQQESAVRDRAAVAAASLLGRQHALHQQHARQLGEQNSLLSE